ncbi:ABC-2 type transport system permease protein [Arcicella aurantiaca]|uniref:ABC-2 type transport system permease protein n=2 Tax=Arcicella aurantiaca TaxID=591202 RepID=A0A316EN72_9BACT|nr:ABC-2 type transport system permease protein [Arcicella aurantiaca]
MSKHRAITMNKILLIIQREYLTRVRKKSFWIASIVVPFLIAGVYAIPLYFILNSNDTKTVEIVDESGMFKNRIKSDKDIVYQFINQPFAQAKKGLLKSDADILVNIPKDIISDPNGVKMVGKKSIGMGTQMDIQGAIQSELRNIKLEKANIDLKVLEDNKVSVNAETYTLQEDGKEQSSNSIGAMILAGVFGMILYISALLYGSQVMNGVIEEKSNRIIEVMISSVRPFQLMMGKIIGVGLVGITQFLLWGILTFTASTATTKLMSGKIEEKVQTMQKTGKSQEEITKFKKDFKEKNPLSGISQTVENISLAKLIFCFLMFYIGGYMIYSSLFAAIGSAVENASEAQQFMFPVTIPIILSFVLGQVIIQEPDSQLAFWASMFPLTSPIDMMVRLPFGVPNWQIALSLTLLILGFLGTTWLAGKVYRVGILMYGKKPSWKEISKWVFYKG